MEAAILLQVVTKTSNNHHVIKCFFWITFLLVRKHWTHTHNFDS